MTDFILRIYQSISKCAYIIFHILVTPALIIFSIISSVLCISFLPCFVDIKPASNFDGAKYIPFLIHALRNKAKILSSDAETSTIFFGNFSEKKNPNIPPIWFVEKGIPAVFIIFLMPPNNSFALASRSSKGFSLIIKFNKVDPAAIARGFPDKVPAWYTGPTGAR